MTPEELFLSQLQLIERVIASICRRHCFFGDEAEEFDAWVKLRLIDDDYAVLRKFRGKSLLKTYLTTVVANLFRDYLIRKSGKWRPSAMAKRRGQEAVQLEHLLYRDGVAVSEAVEILKRNAGVELSREELTELAAKLPVRPPRRFESDDKLQHMAEDGRVEERVRDRERAEILQRVEGGIAKALARLEPEDRLILKRWLDGFAIARIASQLGLEQRRLYTRKDKALRELAAGLEEEGLTSTEVLDLLAWDGLELDLGLRGGEKIDTEEDADVKGKARMRKTPNESV